MSESAATPIESALPLLAPAPADPALPLAQEEKIGSLPIIPLAALDSLLACL